MHRNRPKMTVSFFGGDFMALFGLFKNKKEEPVKPEPVVEVKTTIKVDKPPEYNPWDKKQGNNQENYAIALFLHSMSSHPVKASSSPDEFPRYVSYDFGIHDPVKFFHDLLKEGYFRESTPSEILKTYTVTDLKKILSDNGEKETGKKTDLIERIEANISPENLPIPKMYSVSDKGLEFIKQNEEFIKLFRNPYNITYGEYIATKGDKSYLSYNDVVWSVFQRREMFGRSFWERRSNQWNRANFLKSEGKLEYALQFYIYALFFDINNPSRKISDWLEEKDSEPDQINSELIENIFELRYYFQPRMLEKCTDFLNPFVPFVSMDSFTRLINDIFKPTDIDVRVYLPKGYR